MSQKIILTPQPNDFSEKQPKNDKKLSQNYRSDQKNFAFAHPLQTIRNNFVEHHFSEKISTKVASDDTNTWVHMNKVYLFIMVDSTEAPEDPLVKFEVKHNI